MIISPIIPIKIMAVICVALLLFKRKGIVPFIRQIIIILLVFAINLQIQIPVGEVKTEVTKTKAYVVFVIDDTLSMLAGDCSKSTARLDAVKSDCEYIIDQLYGSDFTVITFNNEAQVIQPFSSEGSYTASVIKNIYPLSSMYAKGTTLNTSHKLMLNTVKKADEFGDGKVILFFISDGEMNSENTLESFTDIAEYVDYGVVMGYGTQNGGTMAYNDNNSVRYIKDSHGNDAVSKIDEENLKQIAGDMNSSYVHMTKQTDIDNSVSDILNLADETEEQVKAAGYFDLYYAFLIPLLLLIIYEFLFYKRKVRL